MSKFSFSILSPKGIFASYDNCLQVAIPARLGEMVYMPGASPSIVTLKDGMVEVTEGGKKHNFFISGGIAKIGEEEIAIFTEGVIDSQSKVNLDGEELSQENNNMGTISRNTLDWLHSKMN